MALAYNGRIGAAMLSEGADYVVNWDGQVLNEEWLVMVKGTQNYDEALAFLIHASAPEAASWPSQMDQLRSDAGFWSYNH